MNYLESMGSINLSFSMLHSAFEMILEKFDPIDITSPTDFICVDNLGSTVKFSKANFGIFVTI